MELARRKRLFLFGIVLASLPIILWIVLPDSLFPKIAALLRTDDRLIEAYGFMAGAVCQFVAAWFFDRAHQRPRDWISICGIALTVCSGTAVMVFFGAMAAVTLQGW
jgi:hypothetical protein